MLPQTFRAGVHYLADGNLFARIPENLAAERCENLLTAPGLRLERIISAGQATPAGEWYDQETHEWVVLLSGAAGLAFEGEPEIMVLRPGDYVHIPAHRRHRVAWTDPHGHTVWLALHYK
jgi:cupin 2 domain-containing protein